MILQMKSYLENQCVNRLLLKAALVEVGDEVPVPCLFHTHLDYGLKPSEKSKSFYVRGNGTIEVK